MNKLALKELNQIIYDQKLLTQEKQDLEKRIIIKLSILGVKATNYSEVVIKMSGVRDKYSEAFAKAESLIRRRDEIVKELNIIEETIACFRDISKNLNDLEYEVFNLKYLEGLTLQDIADKKNYSLDRVKQISAGITKKISCQ